MSAPHKLRPAPDSQLRRLKELSAEERAEIYSWKDLPGVTNADIRKRITVKFGIGLQRDGQLSVFWPWQRRQAQWDRYNELVGQDEAELMDRHPNVSREQLREATIKRMLAEADLEEDPQFGLKVIAMDLKDERARFDREKYRDSLKSKLQAGLDAVAEAFRGMPEAMKLYQEAREMIGRETG